MEEKNKSKAPTPINHIHVAPLITGKFNTEVKGAANWKHWRHVSTVELWQALLLSFDIEPTGAGWLLNNISAPIGDIPYEYLDSKGLTEKFINRWYLIKNRIDTLCAKGGMPPNTELTSFSGLAFFASLAVELEWEDLPEQLVALTLELPKQDNTTATSDTIKASTDSTSSNIIFSTKSERVNNPPLFSTKEVCDAFGGHLLKEKDANWLMTTLGNVGSGKRQNLNSIREMKTIKGRRCAFWQPFDLAQWLIKNKYLNKGRAKNIIDKNFSYYSSNAELL